MRAFFRLVLLLVACLQAPSLAAADNFIILASTTSTDNSGLLNEILPKFKAVSGVEVRTLVRGTGQAIRLAEAGDADLLLVHHRPSEEAFVAAGHGLMRRDVMYNDFVLVGPRDNPAGLVAGEPVSQALQRIAETGALFASRGDDSGTHKKELNLWQAAGIDLASASGGWYRELGSGMGATLNAAAAMGAHVLTDRATWVAFANKADLTILTEGDPALFNQYGVIVVNPSNHPHIKAQEAEAFVEWLTGAEGQAAIAAFRVDDQQLFFPNATKN